MKIAIEELLAAMDLAAVKALGQQQFNLLFTGVNLTSQSGLKTKPLVISGNTLEIKPEILESNAKAVTVKITVSQKNPIGETTSVLAAQSLFIKMPGPENAIDQVPVFATISSN